MPPEDYYLPPDAWNRNHAFEWYKLQAELAKAEEKMDAYIDDGIDDIEDYLRKH